MMTSDGGGLGSGRRDLDLGWRGHWGRVDLCQWVDLGTGGTCWVDIKEEDHSLGGGWSCGAAAARDSDIPIEGDELLRVVLNPGLADEFVTHKPEHSRVGLHLGYLLRQGEGDLDLGEGLVSGLDRLLESVSLGGPSDHLMNLGPVHPVEEAGLAVGLAHLLSVEVNLLPVHHSLRGTYSHHERGVGIPRVSVFLSPGVVLGHSHLYSFFNDLLEGYRGLRVGRVEHLADDVHNLVIVIHTVADVVIVFHNTLFLMVELLFRGCFLSPLQRYKKDFNPQNFFHFFSFFFEVFLSRFAVAD